MANETRIVDEDGVTATVAQLREKEFVSKLDTNTLEDLAYAVKSLKSPIKNVEEETKKRLKKGGQFNHISLTETTTKTIPNNIENKNILYEKYGIDAFNIKSPKQLADTYGESIQKDISDMIVYTKSPRAKFD